jgi:hypothetical protein
LEKDFANKDSRYSRQVLFSPIAIIALLAVILLGISGCSTAEKGREFISDKLSSDDEMDAAIEVVDRFFAHIMEKDFEEAYGLISKNNREEKTGQEFISEFRDVTDIVKVEINWVEVNNNVGAVGIDLIDTYDGEQKMYKDIEVSLIKEEDGSWKIVFWD